MSRITLPEPEAMSPAQRQVYDAIISGPRARLVGPLRAALHNPELADRWQKMGALLRFGTSIPPRLSELAILVSARRWNSQLEWYIHATAAQAAGLPASVIGAIQIAAVPHFDDADDFAVYEFARQILQSGSVSDAVYQEVLRVHKEAGVVELGAIVGYYSMVSMTLNVHQIPMPDECVAPPLSPVGADAIDQLPGSAPLTEMPAAVLTAASPGATTGEPMMADRAVAEQLEPVEAVMPRPPRVRLPENACDTHNHVFGPYDTFPLAQVASYAPPLAPAELHDQMLATIGATRGVLVQPSPYGSDAAALLDALSRSGGRVRGIGVADAGIGEAALRAWVAAGVRGLRFVEMRDPHGKPYKGSVGVDQLAELAPLMRKLGLHAQLWAAGDDYERLLPQLLPLGVPLVLDHMASLDVARGVDHAPFQNLLGWLRQGAVWIKLSVCRVSKQAPGYADLKPFHDALVAANSGRLLWGSDWPFVRMGADSPDVGALLDLFYEWVPDPAVRRQILVDNPALLYGFGQDSDGRASSI